ncbi:hypothetical protein WG66_008724 [Moniliophthora roreri]|nr:hypothetical protein WG66_008724 [Moniliophthora roreri]
MHTGEHEIDWERHWPWKRYRAHRCTRELCTLESMKSTGKDIGHGRDTQSVIFTKHLDFLPPPPTSLNRENTLNHVHGYQVNGTINAETVNFYAGQAVAKRTEYNQFREVIRGDMIPVKELYSQDLSKWDWKWQSGKIFARHKARRTIYTVEIVDRQSKFTAMVYEGKDPHGIWEDDFRLFSQINDPGSVRLFGINQSAIPALIFHYELIPLAHIFTGSIWMDVYIAYLKSNMECQQNSLWMNTTNGVLVSGPQGPYFSLRVDTIGSVVVPRTVDMLKDDTFLRFFSQFGPSVNNTILACARWTWKATYLDDLLPVTTDHETGDPDHSARISPTHHCIHGLWWNLPHHLPMNNVGRLRLDTVYSPSLEAVARRSQGADSLWKWERYIGRGLADKTVLDGELTRFKFDPTHRGEVCLRAEYGWWKFWGEWLSQSCRVFGSLDVTEEEEKFYDTFLRFFSKFGSGVNNTILACARWTWKATYLDDLLPVTTDHEIGDPDHSAWISPTHHCIHGLWWNLPHHLPMNNVGRLRLDTVYSPSLEAVARRSQGADSLWKWERYIGRGLADKTVLDGELTRFKFDPTHRGEVCLRAEYGWWKFWGEWLSQSCRIFGSLDVTEGEEKFFIIDPPILVIQSTPRLKYESFEASFSLRDGKPPLEETEPPPIYLFLHPLPMTISEFMSWGKRRPYFWSLDETGQCEMSEEECKRSGLPLLTCPARWEDSSVQLRSWPTSTYTAFRDWQKARGFDPTTSDWARELGYPVLEIIGDQGRFEEVGVQEEKRVGGSWWEAFAGSGISAFGL